MLDGTNLPHSLIKYSRTGLESGINEWKNVLNVEITYEENLLLT